MPGPCLWHILVHNYLHSVQDFKCCVCHFSSKNLLIHSSNALRRYLHCQDLVCLHVAMMYPYFVVRCCQSVSFGQGRRQHEYIQWLVVFFQCCWFSILKTHLLMMGLNRKPGNLSPLAVGTCCSFYEGFSLNWFAVTF